MTKLNDKFNFFVPAKFEKSGENGEMKISGICSSSVEDSDGETLEPSGFDFQPLLEKGYYNWNHQASKDPGAILGRPVKASIINQGKEFYTEGFLYKGLPQAKDLYQLAKTLEIEDPERRLGFSIEGQAIQRDPINPKRITKARITGIAITHCPKNPNTLLNIIKGEYQEPFIEEQIEEIDTEKSGVGSRGGKIVGYTKSGKPLYESANDHLKQMSYHLKKRFRDPENQEHHDNVEHHLKEYIKKQGVPADEVDNASLMEDEMYGGGSHKNVQQTEAMTKEMAADWAKEHQQTIKKGLPQAKDLYQLAKTLEIEEQVEDNNTEKGGEGSRGGKVIGHTKSGKPIYHSKKASDYSDFTKEDHLDAAEKHNEIMNHHDRMAQKYSDEGKYSAEEKSADRMSHHDMLEREHRELHSKSDEKTEKSMDTSNVPAPESIDGVKKTLSKSEIYLSIFNTYTNEVEKAEQIYNFTQQVSQKIFNMTEITPEVLEKAFQLLDSSIEKSKKSDLNGEEKKPEDYDNEEEVEKACSMLAKEKLEKGSSRGQAIDDLVEKGYSLEMSQGCVDRCIQEMNAKKDGGDITSASTLKKSEVDVLQKSLEQIGLNIDEKFSALGQILKSQVEQNDLLKSEVANLQKSNTDLTTQLQKLSSTPFPTKSVRDVRAVDRFEKSSDGKQVLSLSDSVQRKTLVDTLFGQVQIMKSQNRDYGQIEKAIMDIEISKSVDQQSQLLISQLGYTVVQ